MEDLLEIEGFVFGEMNYFSLLNVKWQESFTSFYRQSEVGDGLLVGPEKNLFKVICVSLIKLSSFITNLKAISSDSLTTFWQYYALKFLIRVTNTPLFLK